jgi:hypothetical protein
MQHGTLQRPVRSAGCSRPLQPTKLQPLQHRVRERCSVPCCRNRSIEQTSAEAVARACEQPERALRARAETMTPIRLAKPVQPQPLRHPVDEAAQSLADRSGQQLGKVVADVLLWMDGLERAGYSGVEAEAAVLQEFEAIKDAGASGDPVARIDACIRARIEQRRSPTP